MQNIIVHGNGVAIMTSFLGKNMLVLSFLLSWQWLLLLSTAGISPTSPPLSLSGWREMTLPAAPPLGTRFFNFISWPNHSWWRTTLEFSFAIFVRRDMFVGASNQQNCSLLYPRSQTRCILQLYCFWPPIQALIFLAAPEGGVHSSWRHREGKWLHCNIRRNPLQPRQNHGPRRQRSRSWLHPLYYDRVSQGHYVMIYSEARTPWWTPMSHCFYANFSNSWTLFSLHKRFFYAHVHGFPRFFNVYLLAPRFSAYKHVVTAPRCACAFFHSFRLSSVHAQVFLTAPQSAQKLRTTCACAEKTLRKLNVSAYIWGS